MLKVNAYRRTSRVARKNVRLQYGDKLEKTFFFML